MGTRGWGKTLFFAFQWWGSIELLDQRLKDHPTKKCFISRTQSDTSVKEYKAGFDFRVPHIDR